MKHKSTIESLRYAVTIIAIAACGETGALPGEPAAGDAGVEMPTSPHEQRVLVTGPSAENRTVPIEGAFVSSWQDGLLTARETDANGLATFAIDANGGPVIVSASYPGHSAKTLVNYDRAVFGELVDADGNLWFNLRPTAPSVIGVQASLERAHSNSLLRVRSNVQDWEKVTENEVFTATALAHVPFMLTAFEQIPDPSPSAARGHNYPITSWHALKHAGSSLYVSVIDSSWVQHSLASYKITVARPRAIGSMAGDDAVPLASANIPAAQDQGIRVPGSVVVAEVSRVAPWHGADHYSVTLTGRADSLARPDLHMSVTILNSQREYTALNFRDGLRTNLTDAYLAPPQVRTADPSLDEMLTWRVHGGEASWVFLTAGDAEHGVRWQVVVPPGMTSLYMPDLVSTLPSNDFGSMALDAFLTACEPDGTIYWCKRESGSIPFSLPRKTTTPQR